MMADVPEGPCEPPQCAAGCGFFGNPATQNFCSKCYKELKKKEKSTHTVHEEKDVQDVSSTEAISSNDAVGSPDVSGIACEPRAQKVIRPPETITQIVPNVSVHAQEKKDGADEGVAEVTSTVDACSESPKKPKKPRCYMCRKKVGMLGFECQCEQIFCSAHRHPDTHACTVDYKSIGRERLRRENQKVEADKVSNRI